MAESKKTEKIDFRPRPKAKNGEKCVSATAEKRKTAKTAFRPRPKLKKRLKQAFQPLGRAKN